MRVLVLGGTGAMGVHLVKLLAERGIETVVTSRTYKNTSGKVSYIKGNALEIDFLQTILKEKWDVIIDFMLYSTLSFKERVKLLLDSTSQYVFLSSARVYSDPKGPITESSPRLLENSPDKGFLATDEYSLTKARQEDILKNSGRTNWTIIRPYITYAENRIQLGVLEKEEWLYRALQGRTIVFSDDINSKLTTLTFGFDVASAIMSILGESKALGESFHVSSMESNTWSYILNIYLDVLEKHLGYRPRVSFLSLDEYNKIETHKQYQIKYDRLFNRHFDCKKISSFYKDPFTSLDKGLTNSLEQFLKTPKFKNINWKAEALKDKQTKEHATLKEISGFKQKIKYILYRHLSIMGNK